MTITADDLDAPRRDADVISPGPLVPVADFGPADRLEGWAATAVITALAALTPISPIFARSSGSTIHSGAGDSSISFWCRRWIEQSRSPRWIVLPCLSAMIWTSTWRGSGR